MFAVFEEVENEEELDTAPWWCLSFIESVELLTFNITWQEIESSLLWLYQ